MQPEHVRWPSQGPSGLFGGGVRIGKSLVCRGDSFADNSPIYEAGLDGGGKG